MKNIRSIAVRSFAIGAAMCVSASLLAGTSSAKAVSGQDDGEGLIGPATTLLDEAELPTDIALPGGGAIRIPQDAVATVGPTSVSISYVDGLLVQVSVPKTRATPAGYYPPIVTTFSRAQTEAAYRMVNNIGNVCRFTPTGWLASIACGASPTVRNAFTQAHYQSKRVQQLFYRSKACSSCSRTDYRVIK